MQDDPPQDELDESQSESSDDDGSDAVEISGVEIEVGNTNGEDSNEEEDPPQSLVLGDSPAGDIESIVPSAVDLGDFLNDVENDHGMDTITANLNDFDIGEDDVLPSYEDLLAYRSMGGIDAIVDDLEYYREKIRQRREERQAKLMPGFVAEKTEEEKTLEKLEQGFLTHHKPKPHSTNLASSEAGNSMFEKTAGANDSTFFGKEDFCLEENAVSTKELADGSSLLSSFSQINVFPSLSHVWISLKLTATHTLLFTIWFMIFAFITNSYLKIFTQTQFLTVLLISITSYGLVSLSRDAIYFMKQISWKLKFHQRLKVLENESSDSLCSDICHERYPPPIPTDTTVFIASLTAAIAVTSYAVGIFFGAL